MLLRVYDSIGVDEALDFQQCQFLYKYILKVFMFSVVLVGANVKQNFLLVT